MPKLNQFGIRQRFGCPGCCTDGNSFTRSEWSKVKQHMRNCCPQFFESYTTGELRNGLCALGQPKCVVVGHSFEIYEARRVEEKAAKVRRKKEEYEAKKEQEQQWYKHDDKLKGGIYNFSDDEDYASPTNIYANIYNELKNLFDENPEGPFGVQRAMGSADDWIHWGCQLAKHWSRSNVVVEEYQNDISLNIKILDKFGYELQEGYQGSVDYIRALHCIFHDTFERCHLPCPPLLNLRTAMNIRDDGVEYKSRMRSFNGYKFRAFSVVGVVVQHPVMTVTEDSGASNNSAVLPPIIPASERKFYPKKSKKSFRYDRYYYDDDCSYTVCSDDDDDDDSRFW